GAAAPYAAGSVSTAVINGKVYMAGGIVGSDTVNTAAVYDPVANSWSSIESMPVGRNHAAAGTDGQKLFIFGGRTGGNTLSDRCKNFCRGGRCPSGTINFNYFADIFALGAHDESSIKYCHSFRKHLS